MTEAIGNAIDSKYKKVVNVINSAGGTPLPVTDILVDILKHIINEDELDFVMAFKKNKSQTLEQLKQSSKLTEEESSSNNVNLQEDIKNFFLIIKKNELTHFCIR
jgi:aspartokinase